MQIDRDAAEWPYRQLAVVLAGRIASGEYPPGGRLPSLIDLTAESGLAPMSVRRALRLLADDGLVEIVPGRGTFVRR